MAKPKAPEAAPKPDTGSVTICGIPHKIVLDKLLPDLYGDYNSTTQTIRLDESLSPDAAEDTLMHEIAHGVFANTGMSDLIASFIGCRRNNKKVDRLEEGLIRMFIPQFRTALRTLKGYNG